jgi:hypothetical protein
MVVSNGLKKLRVLHCPWNIGGQAASLAAAEREIGLSSMSVAWRAGSYGFQPDEILVSADARVFAREAARFGLLKRALSDADVVHFNWGETIFPTVPPGVAKTSTQDWKRSVASWAIAAAWYPFRFSDLKFLRARRKTIAMTFQGDDARQGDWQLKNCDNCIARFVDSTYYSPASDAWKRKRIAAYDRHVDLIYALNPDLLHVLPARAKFMPYATVDAREWKPTWPQNRIPVVLHAPSHRGAKGTGIVIETMGRLKAEGMEFEFRLVEGLKHWEARRVYAEADILVDQLLAGFYGSLAVELMALGKPVVCYLRDGDMKFLPAGMRADLPIINASPESLTDVMRDLLGAGRHRLTEIGVRSRSFVERWHDPIKIARDVASDYQAVDAAVH